MKDFHVNIERDDLVSFIGRLSSSLILLNACGSRRVSLRLTRAIESLMSLQSHLEDGQSDDPSELMMELARMVEDVALLKVYII